MEKKIIVVFIAGLFVTPVFADKPGWSGKGKPTAEMRDTHKKSMQAKKEIKKNQNHEMVTAKGKGLKDPEELDELKQQKFSEKSKQWKTLKASEDMDEQLEVAELKQLKKPTKLKDKKILEVQRESEKQPSGLKGLEKQKVKKSQQVQNELDKGSDKGQVAIQNSKKWWKFWGD